MTNNLPNGFESVSLVVLADTHLTFPRVDDLPEGDLLIHAGDVTDCGWRHSKAELTQLERFLAEARAHYSDVLILHGNHDLGFDNARWLYWGVTPLDGLTWQHRSGLTFHGVSLTPAQHCPELLLQWHHMTIDDAEEDAAWDFSPVDVVVAHGPPFGYLDLDARGRRLGSRSAVSYIRVHQPRLYLCGHIHEAAGEAWLRQTRIVNAAERVVRLELPLAT